MMSVTGKTIDFAGKNLVSCGCSSNASFDRYTVRNPSRVSSKGCGKGHGACKLFCCTKRNTQCRVSSMKTAEPTLNGGTQAIEGLNKGLNLKGYSEAPISASGFFEAVADDLLTLNKNLQSIVGAENPVLMSAAEQIFSAGGKRMRPALVFLVARATAELLGLKELTVKHRRLAEIIEMIHTASLIHDDVLDESDLRRGKKTMHQIFGTRVAVLAGDFMFAQSSWYLANLENIEVIKLISQVIKDFASGEIKQASSLFDCDVQLEEYLIKSYYKTASLIAASTKGAAIFSGADSGITEKMYEYGRNLGLSFQIVDDILDFTQSAEQLGKPSGSDLAKGNLTAPVIFALEKEPKLRDIIESEFSEGGSLDEAINMVKSCGSIERAQELAREKADLAIQSLQCLPQSVYRLALEDMVAYNLQRIA
ncbi:probable solanesyl-diphosphate synthase 3, chloroplastic [Vigna radiata var. radiata]|uniref:Probable solanesyl-diphosphate synthase 3, chloroplastic n=1 Tax=Vigna radiata var. radiata TaxID=3916 RepID=A0A1S3U7B5_VIGRR|nr:probable solanesyl-diphosphate synthase 3, chloroplastic [Vigna radiata var. radiata]